MQKVFIRRLACNPLSGTIYFGDIDINKILFESIGQKVGVVLQAPPMFGLTIRENLRLAKKYATYEELSILCEKANIFEIISSLPDSFEVLLENRA